MHTRSKEESPRRERSDLVSPILLQRRDTPNAGSGQLGSTSPRRQVSGRTNILLSRSR